jgi:FixJ family two-component response regulator
MPPQVAATRPDGELPITVLLVSSSERVRRRHFRILTERVAMLIPAIDAREARLIAAERRIDLAIIDRDLADGCGLDLAEELADHGRGAMTVLTCPHATIDDAARAMQAGGVDLILHDEKADALKRRLEAACRRAAETLKARERTDKLRRLCHRLNEARREMSGQVGELCNDLVTAYRDLSEQMGSVQVRTELEALLRQELEIESLLRTLMEFVLAKVGPTNAAVFLPNSAGEFTLGAYINYDCPKDAAEPLMDRLADTLAPKFEDRAGLVRLRGAEQLSAAIGPEASWLDGSEMLVTACHEDEECLAVLAVFRDGSRGFNDQQERIVAVCAEQFGKQLARIVKVHHRHLPKDSWGILGAFDPEEGDDGLDDYGLAA